MTATATGANTFARSIRWALGVGGLVALVIGILILVWPLKTAAVVTAMIAIYAIITGLVYLVMAFVSKTQRAWARVGHVVLGLLFIVAGIVALMNLAESTLLVAVFVAVFVGVTWMVEGVVALTTLGGSGRGWTIFFAIVSIIAGLMLLISPLFAAAFLWLFLAWSLVILGVIQIVRAFTFGKAA